MKKQIISALKMLFFLGLGVSLVWYGFKDFSESDRNDLYQSFLNADYFWLFVTVVLILLSNLSRAIRWRMLIEPSGYKPSILNSFLALMIGYLANYAFPRLGEVTRCGMLKKYEDVPVSTSLATVVLERVVDLICLGIVILGTIVWKYSLISATLAELIKENTGQGESSNLKIIVLSVVSLSVIVVFAFRKKLRSHPIFSKVLGFLKGFWDGLLSIKNLKNPWMFVFHSVFIWVMYILSLFLGFYGLKETAGLPFDASLVSLVFGTFGMILVQGGIGAYPAAVQYALELYGIPSAVGFAFGWLAWGSQTIMYVLIGVLALIFMPILNQRKDEPR